jgi:endonuclease I
MRAGSGFVVLAFGLCAAFNGVYAGEGRDLWPGVDESSAAALRASLHEQMDDHSRFPYTSSETDTWDILEMADQDPNDADRIVTLYRNASYAKRGGGNNDYNREHTWPRSFGFPDNDGQNLNYPFTDMHHLFLADADYNSERSNKPFEDCDATCAEWATDLNAGRGGEGGGYPGDSNWTDGDFTFGRWEVWNQRKGDIARAMMYMDVRYEGGTHGLTGASEPDLILTNDRDLIESARTNQNEPMAYMGMLDTLLEWHQQDPVDDIERQHHEAVAAAQGNRNPFIDVPQWAGCVFLDVCGVQINAGFNDLWVNLDTLGQGIFVVVYPEIRKMFIGHFTFEVEPPLNPGEVILGAPDQRWITGLGDFSGNTAVISMDRTTGGVFDDSPPEPVSEPGYATYTLVFEDCMNGTVSYDYPGIELQGEFPITRVASDNVALCEELDAQVVLRY